MASVTPQTRRSDRRASRRTLAALTTPRSHPRVLQRQAVGGVRRAVPRLRPRPRHRPAAGPAVPVPRSHHSRDRRAVRDEGRRPACEAEYDVPPDAWYFAANRCEKMPFAVLLEIALQPCGWLAAYCGSALTSAEDLSFRNLGGKATQFRPVDARQPARSPPREDDEGLAVRRHDYPALRMRCAIADGDRCTRERRTSASSRRRQLAESGRHPRREGAVADRGGTRRAESGTLAAEPPFPAPMLRMVDRIERSFPTAGRTAWGWLSARSRSIPDVLVLPGALLPGPGLARVAGAGIVPATAEVRGVEAVGRAGCERLADSCAEPAALVGVSRAGASRPTAR